MVTTLLSSFIKIKIINSYAIGLYNYFGIKKKTLEYAELISEE